MDILKSFVVRYSYLFALPPFLPPAARNRHCFLLVFVVKFIRHPVNHIYILLLIMQLFEVFCILLPQNCKKEHIPAAGGEYTPWFG